MDQGVPHGPGCNAPSARRWYCIQTKPRAETIALEHLQRQGFECLLPRLRLRRLIARRLVERIEPLFPRYLFLAADPTTQSLAPIRSTRGVLGLVRFANEPAEVPPALIARLRADADPTGILDDRRQQPQPGDRVLLLSGPLTGLHALYAQTDGADRAIVLLQILGRDQRLVVPIDMLCKTLDRAA